MRKSIQLAMATFALACTSAFAQNHERTEYAFFTNSDGQRQSAGYAYMYIGGPVALRTVRPISTPMATPERTWIIMLTEASP
jgi:hypothetical protein